MQDRVAQAMEAMAVDIGALGRGILHMQDELQDTKALLLRILEEVSPEPESQGGNQLVELMKQLIAELHRAPAAITRAIIEGTRESGR